MILSMCAGRSPLATSASVTDSRTSRRFALTATHSFPRGSAEPANLIDSAASPRTLASGPSTVVQQIQGGKLRALAHWGDHPLSALPDVPSLKQLGYPVRFAQWSALFVPAGTPDDVIRKLRAASARAAADPTVRQVIAKAGSPIEYLDAPEFQAYWDADAAEMTKAVRAVGKVE